MDHYRALFVKNLRFVETLATAMADRIEMTYRSSVLIYNSYNVTPEELFDLFGKFGPIRYVHSGFTSRSVLTI
jgi:RNA recognition motif-containing protein